MVAAKSEGAGAPDVEQKLWAGLDTGGKTSRLAA
jgi:hypothetical protein